MHCRFYGPFDTVNEAFEWAKSRARYVVVDGWNLHFVFPKDSTV